MQPPVAKLAAIAGLLILSSLALCSCGKPGPISATPSVAKTCKGLTVELGEDSSRGITLRRRAEKFVIPPASNTVWTKMGVAEDGNVAFLWASEDLGDHSYRPLGLICIALPARNESISSHGIAPLLNETTLSGLLGEAYLRI
jgi:hypothetical protein